MGWVGAAVALAWLGGGAWAAMGAGTRCGQLRCTPAEFCDSDGGRCTPCTLICDDSGHNFDNDLCLKHCRDFLYDLRYMRRDESQPQSSVAIEKLQFQVKTLTIVNALEFVFLVVICIVCCWKYGRRSVGQVRSWIGERQKTRQARKYPNDLTHQNPHTESPTIRRHPVSRREPVAPENGRDTHQNVPREPISMDGLRRHDITVAMPTLYNYGGGNPRGVSVCSNPEVTTTQPAGRIPSEDSIREHIPENRRHLPTTGGISTIS